MMVTGSSSYSAIYRIVRMIPVARVATYGQIARLAGFAGQARRVGYALHNLPDDSDVPWHRVVNRNGRVSLADAGPLQKSMLVSEGVVFDTSGTVDLSVFQWVA